MQFDTLISNILSDFQNSGKNAVAGRLKVNFDKSLTVFVILCGIQCPRGSIHLIGAKFYLFVSFRCINHLFLS